MLCMPPQMIVAFGLTLRTSAISFLVQSESIVIDEKPISSTSFRPAATSGRSASHR